MSEKCFSSMNATDNEIKQMAEVLFEEYQKRRGVLYTEDFKTAYKVLAECQIINHAKRCAKYARILNKIRKQI